MRIAICEDDSFLRHQLAEMLAKMPSNGGSHQITQYESADQLWFDFQGYIHPFDLLILDIEMPGVLNGLAAAKKIRKLGDNVTIVLLTAYDKYALEGYDIQAYKYLLKPVSRYKLEEIITQVEGSLRLYWNECLNLMVAGGILRIPFDDIHYLESNRHNAFIYVKSGRHKCYRKLSDLHAMCDERFVYCHKSYIINLEKVRRINFDQRYTTVLLDNDVTLPVSQQKKRELMTALAEYDRKCGTIRA